MDDSSKSGNFADIIHKMAVVREDYQIKTATIIQEFLKALDEKQKKRFFEHATGNKTLNALLSG